MADNDKDDKLARDKDGRISVLLEMRADPGVSHSLGQDMAADLGGGKLKLDPEFAPVPMSSGLAGDGMAVAGTDSFILRGTVKDEDELHALENDPQVLRVWKDTPIEPFAGKRKKGDEDDDHGLRPQIEPSLGMGPCPIGTCDCDPNTARGSMADVARYLGVDQIWARGHRGAGIVVGVVDGGITAQGRPVKPGETSRRIARVIGGWPTADWGTEASRWGEHGNMCATDVLGMAPEAQIYDMRIGGSGGSTATISRALQAYQWAIDQFRRDGTPHVLSNSWGIFQESWDRAYARDPNHPFTRKVLEAINLGIIVLFAAGNCGDTCPDGRCGRDVGSGRSIWGANGHEKVMTVGAVNIREQFVGYSSRGPAALHPQKPDFCSVTHFRGYYPDADSGTSAATPILAGVCALFMQAKPGRSQAQIKADLVASCKDIGPSGFDIHSGHGIVRPKAAYDRMTRITKLPGLDTPIIPDRVGTPVTLDNPRTPLVPDRIGTPIVLDNPRTPVHLDNPRTPVYLDTPRTPVVPDRVGTPITLDNPRTPIVPDRVGTPIVLDQGGTPVTLDQGGTPPLADKLGTSPLGDQGIPPIDPPKPFVLSTQHHAPDWESFDEMLNGGEGIDEAEVEAELAQLIAQIDEAHTVLESLVEHYQQLTGAGSSGTSQA